MNACESSRVLTEGQVSGSGVHYDVLDMSAYTSARSPGRGITIKSKFIVHGLRWLHGIASIIESLTYLFCVRQRISVR